MLDTKIQRYRIDEHLKPIGNETEPTLVMELKVVKEYPYTYKVSSNSICPNIKTVEVKHDDLLRELRKYGLSYLTHETEELDYDVLIKIYSTY